MKSNCPQIVSEDLKEITENAETYIGASRGKDNGKFSILLKSSPSWKDKIYFKVYISHRIKLMNSGFRTSKSTKMYRISLYKSEYITAKDNGEKGYMSKDEISEMIKILKRPESWSRAIEGLNEEHELDGTENGESDIPWKPIPENLPMPDYAKLPTRD